MAAMQVLDLRHKQANVDIPLELLLFVGLNAIL